MWALLVWLMLHSMNAQTPRGSYAHMRERGTSAWRIEQDYGRRRRIVVGSLLVQILQWNFRSFARDDDDGDDAVV